ncbi:hypothetical protein OAP11_02965 [Bacteroidia bacterium]|nr:hypothetical protein [Bacteroidia bacterium]MDC0579702.1 hypothetical protein [Bacteroidia bacterium]
MILIIDDKKPTQNPYCWDNYSHKLELFKNEFQYTDLSDFDSYFVKIGPALAPKFEINKYDLIFFHNSFNETLFNDSQITSLRLLFKEKFIGFSGDRDNINNEAKHFSGESSFAKKLYREYFYKNIKLFVHWKLISGSYDIGLLTYQEGTSKLITLLKTHFLTVGTDKYFFQQIANLLSLTSNSERINNIWLTEFKHEATDNILTKIDELYHEELRHYNE